MSFGNDKGNGNKGNNFPFQHNILKGVQKLVDNNDESSLRLISKLLEATIRKPGREVYSSGESGTIAPGFRSFTVSNEGSTEALLDGKPLSAGKFETYDADGNADVLDEMTFNAQATTLVIHTVL